MFVNSMQAGVYAVNCYIVHSEETKDGIVIDPGGDSDDIIKYIEENNINLKYIVLTHGHGDHIGGASDLKEHFNIPVLIHEDDVGILGNCNINLSNQMAMGCVEIKPDEELKDGDTIEFGDIKAEVIHTPGHTPGGICLKAGKYLFTGDTLFKGSVGRSDLYGGDGETLNNSIKTKLVGLSDDVIVCPGHGAATNMKYEKETNPFLKSI